MQAYVVLVGNALNPSTNTSATAFHAWAKKIPCKYVKSGCSISWYQHPSARRGHPPTPNPQPQPPNLPTTTSQPPTTTSHPQTPQPPTPPPNPNLPTPPPTSQPQPPNHNLPTPVQPPPLLPTPTIIIPVNISSYPTHRPDSLVPRGKLTTRSGDISITANFIGRIKKFVNWNRGEDALIVAVEGARVSISRY